MTPMPDPLPKKSGAGLSTLAGKKGCPPVALGPKAVEKVHGPSSDGAARSSVYEMPHAPGAAALAAAGATLHPPASGDAHGTTCSCVGAHGSAGRPHGRRAPAPPFERHMPAQPATCSCPPPAGEKTRPPVALSPARAPRAMSFATAPAVHASQSMLRAAPGHAADATLASPRLHSAAAPAHAPSASGLRPPNGDSHAGNVPLSGAMQRPPLLRRTGGGGGGSGETPRLQLAMRRVVLSPQPMWKIKYVPSGARASFGLCEKGGRMSVSPPYGPSGPLVDVTCTSCEFDSQELRPQLPAICATTACQTPASSRSADAHQLDTFSRR